MQNASNPFDAFCIRWNCLSMIAIGTGADLDQVSENGDTVLHYFADFGFVELAHRCPLSLFVMGSHKYTYQHL